MRCTSPRTVGFQADGKTIAWSQKQYSKEFATFQLPCGKCLECRLEYARQWAVRCVHEASMYEKNAFITLTYESLEDTKLKYTDFQKFMKKLRKLQDAPMGVFVTGEYGEKNKRPHWHAIIFNWCPSDGMHKYTNHNGDRVYGSETLNKIWNKGMCDYGSVTMQSAGYVARYAAKKLVHGKDDEHEFEPISKKSSKHAIGKRWLERYWSDVFVSGNGSIILPDGTRTAVPRYYEKWLKENRPEDWLRYVTHVKTKKSEAAILSAKQIHKNWVATQNKRLDEGKLTFTFTENERRALITEDNFNKRLQANLKL